LTRDVAYSVPSGSAASAVPELQQDKNKMSNNGPDGRIAELQSLKESLCLQLEQSVRAFIQASQSFAEQELRNSVQHAVTSQYDLTRRLGKEGIRLIKLELEQLIDGNPQKMLDHLNKDSLWPHRSDDFNHSNVTYSNYRSSTVSPLPVELSRAVGEVLKQTAEPLLKKHGFVFGASRAVQSEEMMATFRKYSELYFQGSALDRELKGALNEVGKAEARKIWDES
jgi:hypothetical protein